MQINRGYIFSRKVIMYWGPTMLVVLDKWGCLPICPSSKILNNFLYKIQFEMGSVLWKNCQLMYLRPHNSGRFEQISLSINLKWTNFELFQQFLVQNQNSKRVYFMEKLTSHVFSALFGEPLWLNASLLTSQTGGQSIFWAILNLKCKIIFGLFNVKSCYGWGVARGLEVKRAPGVCSSNPAYSQSSFFRRAQTKYERNT